MPATNTTPSNDSTRVFRVPSNDVTAPDLMRRADSSAPVLTIIKGPQSGASYPLEGSEISVGRDPKNAIFLNDMTVSRRHARMDLSGLASGVVTIEDLGSLNGTWVDGAIVSKASLKDGSTIQIGTFRMVFHTNTRPRRIDAEA